MKNGMRAITRQIRLKEWTEVFRDRAESGMLVKDYCDAHGITKDAYYYWLRKVHEAAIESSGVFLQAPFGKSCEGKMDNLACPKRTKLQGSPAHTVPA